jgi:streptomycin 6-kinase
MKFIRLEDWFAELKNIRPKFDGGTGPFPREIFEHVETILPELFMGEQQLIHGDFHHFNILSSERGWLIIDPKGVVGPVGYEIGPLMLNPWYGSMDSHQFKVHAERRVDIFRERLGWEREKIIGWALAHSVLSAYWDLELNPTYSFEAARIFSEM